MVTKYNYLIYPAQTEPGFKPKDDFWAMQEADSPATCFAPNPEDLHKKLVKKYGQDVPEWDTINEQHDENGNPYYEIDFEVIVDDE